MPAADMTRLIEEAIRDRHVLQVTYLALDGIESVNVVGPMAIRFNQSGHRVLWCFNRDAGHLEQFLGGRIEDASETGKVFAPRPWREEG